MARAEKQSQAIQLKVLDIFILVVAVGLLVFLASYAFLLWESPNRLVLVFVPLVLILWSLLRMRDGMLLPVKGRWNLPLGIIFIALSAYSAYYFYSQYHSLLFERAANNNLTDIVLGGALLLLVVLSTWRQTGSAIPIVFFVFIAYAFLGKYIPSGNILHHAGLSFPAFMRFSVLTPDGIFGTLPVAGFTLIVVFLFFAGLVQGFGGLAFVMNVSMKLTNRIRWGLIQIPVISSMFFGTFSGSAAANVAGTGSFTIPMMKRFGVPPTVAGAIEAVASSGGQIMPPVMGLAAFLMADILGIPYIRIALMGLAPALIFYCSTALAVHLIAQDMPISNLPRAKREELREAFRVTEGLPILVALLVLLFFLTYMRSSVLVAGMWMVITYIVGQFLLCLFRGRFSVSALGKFLRDGMDGVRGGAFSAVEIMALLGAMGVVAKMLVVTGLSQKLSFLMVDLSGGNLFPLLSLIFVVSILMGMAVSTVVVYILVALLAAPALAAYGIPTYAAHYTVFYLAIVSAITPPVALAVAVACGIAKSPFMKTGWEAMRIGLPLFILPLAFLFKPGIVAADLGTTPIAFLQIFVGCLAITYAIHSKSRGIRGYGMRFLFFALGGLDIFSTADYVVWPSLGVILSLALFVMAKRRTAPRPADAIVSVQEPSPDKQ